MANNVKFSTGLQDDLLKRNSDNSYVHKIENGHVYFATRENDEGETIGSIFYDVNGKRVSMGGGVAEQAKADDMKQNIADTYVTRISSEGAKYASTDGVTLTTYNGRNAVLDTILLPVAGTDRAGVVITGAQTFAGNKTFTGIIHLTNTRDADKGSDSGVLIIGDKDGSHLIFDDNEIMAKNKTNGTGVLYLNADGGTVYIGGNFLPNGTTKTLSLGSATAYWKEAYIGNVVTDTLSGHLTGSLTGNVTGNVTGHASLDLPLAGGTMTGDISFATIASWPTASGETYPIKSKGLKWSGSSDNASIYYVVEASDKGVLYLDMGDDTGGAIKFAMGGTAHTVFESNGNIYPVITNKGSLGTSDNKFASVYATNFYGIIDKAYGDESGNNIQASYGAKLQAHTHDGSGWSFRLLNKNGGALADTLTVPGATDSKAGLITTGEQKFAGKKTFSGQVVITGGSDTSKGTANSGQLIVGDPAAEHLAIDGNEIMAKASGSTTRALLFQLDGGDTKFGGNVSPHTTNAHSLGTQDLAWKEAHIGEIYGHLNGAVTGTLSGNASSASKWLTARKVTMTGDVTGNFTIDGSKDVSYTASIANYSLKPVKLAVQDYANYSQLNRHTAAHWGFSVDTTPSSGAEYTMITLSRDKFISEEFPCSGGEKLLITYEISTSVMGNTTSGGTDSAYRGTAIGVYGYQYANKSTSAGIAYSTRVTATAAAPWTKVSSIVTVPSNARYFYIFVQTESWGNYSGTLKLRNLEVRRVDGIVDSKGDEIAPKYIANVDFTQADVSSTDATKKLNIRLYNGNGAVKSTIQVPNASTSTAGVVNTGTQSFAGNKTFTGRIHFSNTTDAAKASDSGVITIGDKSGEHMLLDNNEIMVKNGASGNSTFHIQAEGGQTEIGGNFIPKSQFTLGSSSNYWGNAYIKNLVADTLSGHLTGSLTGNVTGNASSATKLQTARKIILGNDLQGEVSFDGTKDVTFTAQSYCCSISGGNTQNYPWRRIATSGTITGSHNDRDMVIAIRHSYNGGGYGIAKVSLRTNNVSSNAVSQCEIRWLVRQNIALDALQAGFRNVAGDTYADIFYKVGTWPRARVYQLQGDRVWTLISSNEADDTTTSDKKTSSEAYATIAAAATALSRTYTSTVIAVDQGYVERAYKDESGNNIKASYLAAIQQVTSDKDTFTFRGYNKNNGAMNNLIIIPAATASGTDNTKWKAGLVTSQAQQWAGTKTFRDNIVISHATTSTVAAGATNPHIRFEEYEGTQPVYLMYNDHDVYRSPAGLKVVGDSSKSSSKAWFEVEGDLIIGANSTLNGNVTVKGNIMPQADNTYVIGDLNTKWADVYSQNMHVYKTLYVNTSTTGSEGGIALHGTTAPTDYGIAMRSNLGAHGYATDTWNTYFSMVGGTTRGWVFRNGGTNVASINGQGYAQFNKISLNRVGASANGRISWYSPTYRTWYDYMENGTTAGSAPTGGQPGQLGSVTGWAMRSLIQNSATYGWVWEATTEAAAASTTTRPTALMALAADTGRLYLSNDLMIMTGDTDKFVHYLYATGAGATNYVGASWRAGVLGSGSANTNYYVIQSGTSSTANTTWENAVRIGQNNYDFTVGTTTKGGIGVANTSNSTGNGISLYGGAMPNSDGTAKSGKPTYGLFFGGTGTFSKHGYVQGDWATYFTMDSTANRGWVFLKGDTAVASINNDGKAQFNETYVTGPLKIGNNVNGDTNYIMFYGTTGDNPGSFNHAYIGENLYGGTECSELVIYKGNDIAPTSAVSGPGPDRIRHIAAAHLFQIYKSALSGTWTTICDSTVPVNVFEINQSGVVVTGNSTISGNTTIGGTLDVTGNTSLGAELSVTSYAKFKQGSAATAINTGALQVLGGLSTTAASYMNGALTVNSTINATGNITAPRFIGLADRATFIDAAMSGTSSATHLTTHPAVAGRVAFYYNVNPCTGLFTADNNANFLITLNKHSGNYDSQLGFSSNGNIYYRSFNGSALNNTTGWQMLLTTANAFGELDGRYVNVTGDTMSGALNFANGTWNKVGDDVQMGDCNIAGAFGLQGLNGATNLRMIQYGGTSAGSITWDGSQFVFSHGISGNASSSSFSSVSERLDSYDTRSATRTPQDTPRGMTLNFKQNSTYGLSDGGSYLGLLSWRSYSSGSDLSGGYPIEIAYTANGNLWTRMGTSATTWGAWNRIIKHSFLQERGLYKDYGYQTSSSNWTSMLAVNQFFSFTNWWDSANTYMPYIYGSGLMIPHLDANYRSFLYCQCNAPVAWVGWVDKSSTNIVKWKRLWGQGDSVTGAVWNDYAECRESEVHEAGYVLCETGKDNLIKTVERMQHFAGVSSDTWGFSQGETEKAKTPIAVAGRVLVYPYQDRNNYKPGDCVCAAPGGKVDIMTREEIINYPDRIVGTVSCVPEYDTWGGGENADRDPVKVNGRIWIKVR